MSWDFERPTLPTSPTTTPPPWPLFVMLLLANGWFLRPQVFDHRGGEFTVPRRLRNAGIRLVFFAAFWIAAVWLLPIWVVALGSTVWFVKVLPGIRAVHAGFQNIAPGDEPN